MCAGKCAHKDVRQEICEVIVNQLSSWVGMLFLTAAMSLPAQAMDPAVAPMARPNAVPEGTTFLVRLEDKLDTAELHRGEHFKVKLDEDLISPNGNMIPRGKKIKGHVSSVERGRHARLLLCFDEIETKHGWIALIATVIGVPGEHGIKAPNSESEIERKGPSAKQTMEDAGAGAAAESADSEGGAGAGAKASQRANRLRLEKGATLEVRLDRALQIPSH